MGETSSKASRPKVRNEETPRQVIYLKEPTLNNLENLDKEKVERFLQEAKKFLEI